jgi:diguanylate cyclase (GGDEF)-like protein
VLTADSSKLLVVDDDENNRDMLSRRLARRGYAVEVASVGNEALEKINQAHYDLVLLDQMMPGVSGLDLLRLLRATYTPSDLPIIVVTAVDQSQSIVDALSHGANDYVMKPVDLPVIAARIEAQISRSRAERRGKFGDALTGLHNRTYFIDRLEHAIEKQKESSEKRGATGWLSVFLLDLDGFRVLNDSFGHKPGDAILIDVASRLQSKVPTLGAPGDVTLARLGGDEFAILVENLASPFQVKHDAEVMRAALKRPLVVEGRSIQVGASIGIALLNSGDAQAGKPKAQELLRDADLAMHKAKDLGKNRYEVFSPSLRAHAQSRMTLALDLAHAIDRGQLEVYYQPKIHLASRTIIGFEALIRWHHPERGLISPNQFIPVAEETGLIIPIGLWILRQSCQQLKTWQQKHLCSPPLSMNVNLSVKQLTDPELVHHVEKTLKQTGIDPDTLKLELTESSLMTEIESAKDMLSHLRELGVGLKLDDFGTGYSSLSYLRTLHFDSLKIDRSFINRLATDRETRAIVRTIIDLARTLNMGVVAEGIESEEQLQELVCLGCDTGQGFLFSKPVTGEAAERLLETPANAA